MRSRFASVSARALLAAVAAGLLLTAADAAPAAAQGYGAAVAVDGDRLFVTEPLTERRPGTIYVYSRGSDGSWVEANTIRSSSAEPGDRFGRALAVQGGTLWTGATAEDSTTGVAYIFTRGEDGSWSQLDRFQPDDLAVDEAFGRAAAMDDDFALVAAWGHQQGRGAVYVFHRDDAGEWSRYDKLMAEDAAENDWFGMSLDVRGDVAVIGAPRKGNGTGSAYVFRHDPASASWRQTAKLSLDGLGENARLGTSVALRDGRILVGSPGLSSFSGAAFEFTYDEEETGWRVASRLLPFDARPGARFGTSMTWGDGELWVGAPGGDRGGEIYRFRPAGEDGRGWAASTRLRPADVQQGDEFGATLAVGDDVAVTGLTGADYGAGTAMALEADEAGEWAASAELASELENYAAITGGAVSCGEDGAAADFPCSNVRLMSFLPLSEIGGTRGVEMSDIWGWTDPETGREYALAGRMDGTAFVDVTDPENPVYLGSLPMTEGARANSWRDIKVYRNHAYVVADGAGEHGVQVFDLTRLRDVEDPPVTFDEDALYEKVHSVHNIVINPESGFAYAVGSGGGGETCGGGLHMIDIRQPENPTFAGCFADTRTGREGTGYTHDAQCVNYSGPDQDYRGREICVGANETALSIADVTDKDSATAISMATYPNAGYTHQGWFGPDQRYFYLNDELDELQGLVERTRTMIWDLSDLDDPIMVGQFDGPTSSTDHNLYVVGDRIFQSHYVTGLRILDASQSEELEEVGYLDTVPYGENEPGFGGSWSNYPFFESGTVVVTSGSEGLFVVRPVDGAMPSEAAREDAGPTAGATPPPVPSGSADEGRPAAADDAAEEDASN